MSTVCDRLSIKASHLDGYDSSVPQDGYIIFNSTMAGSLGMILNQSNPNIYNLDLFNAERHTTGSQPDSPELLSGCSA